MVINNNVFITWKACRVSTVDELIHSFSHILTSPHTSWTTFRAVFHVSFYNSLKFGALPAAISIKVALIVSPVCLSVCWVVSLFVLKCVNRLYIAHSSHTRAEANISYTNVYTLMLADSLARTQLKPSNTQSVCLFVSLSLPLSSLSFSLSLINAEQQHGQFARQ